MLQDPVPIAPPTLARQYGLGQKGIDLNRFPGLSVKPSETTMGGVNRMDWETLISDAPEWFQLAFWAEDVERELECMLPLGIV